MRAQGPTITRAYIHSKSRKSIAIAEVLEAGGGIIGIIQLAGKIDYLGYGYIGGIPCAPKDIRDFVDELALSIKYSFYYKTTWIRIPGEGIEGAGWITSKILCRIQPASVSIGTELGTERYYESTEGASQRRRYLPIYLADRKIRKLL